MKNLVLKQLTGLGLLASVCLMTQQAYADITTTVTSCQDLMIFGKSLTVARNSAYANGIVMFAGADSGGEIKRSLFQFDVSSIPAGSTITGVTLTLYLAQVAGTGGQGPSSPDTYLRTLSLYTINQEWAEGPSGNPNDGISGYGHGVTATTGDVTWDYAYYSTDTSVAIKWGDGATTLQGGNYNSVASASTGIDYVVINNPYTWSSAGMIADVQAWIDGTKDNYGWEMISAVESTAQSYLAFYTSEAAENTSGTYADYVPTLTITYTTVPEPAGLALMAASLPMLLRRRRKA